MRAPTIYTRDIDAKLKLIEKFGGKKLKDKTSISARGNMDAVRYLKILMETRWVSILRVSRFCERAAERQLFGLD